MFWNGIPICMTSRLASLHTVYIYFPDQLSIFFFPFLLFICFIKFSFFSTAMSWYGDELVRDELVRR